MKKSKPLKGFLKMTPAINRASEKAHVLDDTIQEILARQDHKDRRFRFSAYTLLGLLLILGILLLLRLNTSINLQNKIAIKNQQHIDCIVKLFTTPLPASAHARTISNPSTTCDINFTP